MKFYTLVSTTVFILLQIGICNGYYYELNPLIPVEYNFYRPTAPLVYSRRTREEPRTYSTQTFSPASYYNPLSSWYSNQYQQQYYYNNQYMPAVYYPNFYNYRYPAVTVQARSFPQLRAQSYYYPAEQQQQNPVNPTRYSLPNYNNQVQVNSASQPTQEFQSSQQQSQQYNALIVPEQSGKVIILELLHCDVFRTRRFI